MHIKTIEFENWMRFRGKTRLELEPKAYALLARSAENPERSNFLGKSSILEAVRFALFGKQNPNRHAGADGWVSDGEQSGDVTIEMSDGMLVTRMRKKATRLIVTQKGCKPAEGDEAQSILEEHLGLTDADYVATSYFEQGQMGRLVLATPGDRTKLVAAWFNLGPLEAAEDQVSGAAAKLAWEEATLRQRLEQARALELQELGQGGSLETVKAQRDDLAKEQEEADGALGLLETRLAGAQKREGAAAIVAAYEATSRELEQVRVDMRSRAAPDEKLLVKVKEAAFEVREELGAANRARSQAEVTRRGEFDGHCPIADVECPARDKINSQHASNERRYLDATALVRQKESKLQEVRREEGELQTAHDEHDRLARKLGTLRQQLERMQTDYEQAKGLEAEEDAAGVRAQIAQAKQRALDVRMKIATLDRSLTVAMQARAEQAHVAAKIEKVAKNTAVYVEATTIFGKGGAQRRIAERALGEIELRANGKLHDAGVDLSVEVSWAREGDGPARTCDACGAPFVESRRVKKCERCGADRGSHMVNRLDLVLSDQSGGAEALVGMAVQLAAAAWLRERRGVRWATALIDEPFGALDAAHLRAVGQAFGRMLAGNEQAIVIAHHTSALDALPGRIEVVGEGRWSSAKVVA